MRLMVENRVSRTANRTKATAYDDGRESVTEIVKKRPKGEFFDTATSDLDDGHR